METRHRLHGIALLASAALLSTGAMALPLDEETETRSETVQYSVPESKTSEGAEALYGKLRIAAQRVCSGAAAGTRIRVIDTACAADALDRAVVDVGSPLVFALHVQKHPDSRLASTMKAPAVELASVASR